MKHILCYACEIDKAVLPDTTHLVGAENCLVKPETTHEKERIQDVCNSKEIEHEKLNKSGQDLHDSLAGGTYLQKCKHNLFAHCEPETTRNEEQPQELYSNFMVEVPHEKDIVNLLNDDCKPDFIAEILEDFWFESKYWGVKASKLQPIEAFLKEKFIEVENIAEAQADCFNAGRLAMKEEVLKAIEGKRGILWTEDIQEHGRRVSRDNAITEISVAIRDMK